MGIQLRRPGSSRFATRAAKRLGRSGDDPLPRFGIPRRGQSVPRPAFGGAMLTLLRLPRLPVSGLPTGSAGFDQTALFCCFGGLRPLAVKTTLQAEGRKAEGRVVAALRPAPTPPLSGL
jgi:hypothetical protein